MGSSRTSMETRSFEGTTVSRAMGGVGDEDGGSVP